MMLNENFNSENFLRSYWRQHPLLLKNLVKPQYLSDYTIEKFFSWCISPAIARLFILTDDLGDGTSKAAHISDPQDAVRLFQHFRDKGEKLTVLLNKTQLVEKSLDILRDSFNIPFHWRKDDIVASLSTEKSGIGFHAGHEDGFIVQLKGKRHWRLWMPHCLNNDYKLKILGEPSRSEVNSPPRPSSSPIFECQLEAGDVLFIPALYGHEGQTIVESISLSVAWRGITPYKILTAVETRLSPKACKIIEEYPNDFFSLLPDPLKKGNEVDFLLEAMTPQLKLLNGEAPNLSELKRVIRNLIYRNEDSTQ